VSAVQIVVILSCLGNDEKKKPVMFVQAHSLKYIFSLQLRESVDAGPTDTEGVFIN
jgi:hypothetical protein